MSCRTTSGGSVSIRLARAFSGLPDSTLQTLFHALKREGTGCPAPSDEMKKEWRNRQRVLLKYAKLTDAQKEHSERDLLRAIEENIDGDIFHSWHRHEVRSRQEIVLDSIHNNVVDLAPPGEQAEQYELGEDGRPLKVWYCSYGSNLSKDRFLTYIKGGTPEGSATSHSGCRNKELPLEDIPIRFDGRMHFSGSSSRWGSGGVAFMDNDNNLGRALGRAYLITMEQFDDIAAQENGRTTGTITAKTDEAIEKGSSILLSTGLYGNLVHIGDYKGAPAFTFTGDFSAEQALLGSFEDKKAGYIKINQPSPNYIRVIGSGLKETFDLTIDQQVDYIRGSLGSEDMTRAKIKDILETPAEVIVRPVRTSYAGSTYSGGSAAYGGGFGRNGYNWDDDYYSTTRPEKNDRWPEESQMTDEEYADEMARFLTEDPDVPWFNDPKFNKPKERVPSVWDEDEDIIEDAKILCRHCKSSSHQTHECLVFTTTASKEPVASRALNKRCVICQSYTHSMHECPDLSKKPSTVTTAAFEPIAKPNSDSSSFAEPLFKPTVTRTNPKYRKPTVEQILRLNQVLNKIGVKPGSSESMKVLKKAIGFFSPEVADSHDLEFFIKYGENQGKEELKKALLTVHTVVAKTNNGGRPGKAGTRAKRQEEQKDSTFGLLG